MNITNETLYEMILEVKADQADLKTSQMELKTAQAELRADISKWGVILFVGSIIAMTSVLSVVVASVLMVTAG